MSRQSRPLNLSDSEVNELQSITKKGTHKSRKIMRAKALLLINSGSTRLEVQTELGIDSNNYF